MSMSVYRPEQPRPKLARTLTILAVLIFATDVFIPRGVNAAIAYVAITCLGTWFLKPSSFFRLAVFTSILAVGGTIFSPPSVVPTRVWLINLSLTLFILWIPGLAQVRELDVWKRLVSDPDENGY